MKRGNGFTLVEVMIALAIFAVVSATLIRSASLAIYQMRTLEDRTLAIWIAENRINELRSGPRNPAKFASPGSDRDSVVMAARHYDVVVDTIATENDNVRRIEIAVYPDTDTDTPIATLTGFVGRY